MLNPKGPNSETDAQPRTRLARTDTGRADRLFRILLTVGVLADFGFRAFGFPLLATRLP
jgi:hypothetical protein